MGASTFQILLVLTLAVMAECSRSLQSTDMNLLVISPLDSTESPPKPSSHPPPPLLPLVQRQQFYEARQPPKAPVVAQDYLHRGYPFGSPAPYKSSSPSVVDMSQVQFWNFQQLHKNPAGPNPIGNDLPTSRRLVKNRSPPPYGG